MDRPAAQCQHARSRLCAVSSTAPMLALRWRPSCICNFAASASTVPGNGFRSSHPSIFLERVEPFCLSYAAYQQLLGRSRCRQGASTTGRGTGTASGGGYPSKQAEEQRLARIAQQRRAEVDENIRKIKMRLGPFRYVRYTGISRHIRVLVLLFVGFVLLITDLDESIRIVIGTLVVIAAMVADRGCKLILFMIISGYLSLTAGYPKSAPYLQSLTPAPRYRSSSAIA